MSVNNDQKSSDYVSLKKRLQQEVARRTGYGSLTQFVSASWLYRSNPDENDEISGDRIAKLINPLLFVNDLPDPYLKKSEGSSFPDLRDASILLNAMENDQMISNNTTCRSACSGTCVGNCTTGCVSCKSDCTSGCYTNCNTICGNGCTTGCGTNCQGNCSKSCGSSCSSSCDVICAGDCNTTCNGICSGCYGTCVNACTSSCTRVCVQSCGSLARNNVTLNY